VRENSAAFELRFCQSQVFALARMCDRSVINLETSSSDDSDSDDDLSPGPSKRYKATAGAAVYKTKFNDQWTKIWEFICKVPGDAYKFRCTIRSRNISCSHMGKADVERHIGKEMHKRNVKSAHSQRKLQFVPASDPIIDKVLILKYAYM